MKVLLCLALAPQIERVLQATKLMLATRVPQPKIDVLHVIDTRTLANSESGQQAEAVLKQESAGIYELAKEYLGTGINYLEEYGTPQIKIDNAISSTSYDLIIVGTKGRSALANAVLGSIAEHLLHHCTIPVMIVP